VLQICCKDKVGSTGLHEGFEAGDPLVLDGIGDERIQVLRAKVKAWLPQQEAESVQIFNLQADGQDPLVEWVLAATLEPSDDDVNLGHGGSQAIVFYEELQA
jgi:hypothetical protein